MELSTAVDANAYDAETGLVASSTACIFRPPVVISQSLYLRIPRPLVHYEANQEEHDEDEETDSGNLSCGKSHKSKSKGTRY